MDAPLRSVIEPLQDAAQPTSVPQKLDQQHVAHRQALDQLVADPRFQGLSKPDQLRMVHELFPDPEQLRALAATESPSLGTPLSRTPAGGMVDAAAGAVTDPATIAGTIADVAGPGGPVGKAAAVGGLSAMVYTADQWVRGEPFDVQKAIQVGASQAAGAVGSNLALRAVGRVLGFGTGTFAPNVSPEAAEAYQYLAPKFAARGFKGPPLDPAHMTDSAALDILYNVADASLLGGSTIKDYVAKRNTVFKSMADDYLNQLSQHMSPEQLAETFVAANEGRINVSKTLSTPLYNTVGHLMQNVPIDTTKIRALAMPIASSSKRLGGVEADRAGASLMAKLASLPETATFTDMQELRSLVLLSKDAAVHGENVPAKKVARVTSAVSEIDGAIETAMKAQRPEALPIWRDANSLVAGRYRELESSFVKRLVDISDPHQLGQGGGQGGDALVHEVFANTNSIRATRTALNAGTPPGATGPRLAGEDAPEWKALQRRYLQTKFNETLGPDGVPNGEKLLGALEGVGKHDAERFAAAFPDAGHRHELTAFAKALSVAQRGQSAGPGRMFLGLSQGAAVVAALKGGSLKNAAVVLLSPRVVASMLTTKTGARLLTRAVKMPASASMAASLVARIGLENDRLRSELGETESTVTSTTGGPPSSTAPH